MKTNQDNLERLVEIVTSEVYRRLETISNPKSATCSPEGCELVDCKAKTGRCDECVGCVNKKPQTVQAMLNEGAVRFSSVQGQTTVDSRFASMIDQTLLKPDVKH